MEPWGATIGAIAAIALLLLKAWQAKAPQRAEEKRDEEIEQGRRDLADGNAAAVSARLDRLLGPAGDGAPGGADGEDQSR